MRDYQGIRTYEELDVLVEELENGPDLIAFDVETGYTTAENVEKRALNTRNEDFIVVGFSITNSSQWARYIPLRHDNDRPLDPKIVWEKFRNIFETKTIIAHNAAFERAALNSLYRAGDVERPLQMLKTGHDTMVMANTLGKYKEVGLKSLTTNVLGETQTEFSALFGPEIRDKNGKVVAARLKKVRFNSLDVTPEVINYGCDDSALCMELYERFSKEMTLAQKRVYSVEMQILVLMSQAEEYGVGVDWASMQEALAQYETFRPRFEKKVREEFAEMTVDPEVKELARTANFGSAMQMRKLLYNGLGMSTTRTTNKGELSTDAKALEALSRKHPAVRSLLSLREIDNLGRRLKKWLKEYSDCYDKRVHPSFNQVRVISGRFAASDPAIQQLGKDWLWDVDGSVEKDEEGNFIRAEGVNGENYWTGNFRKFIVSAPNKTLLTFDYANQEIRVLAGLTQEPAFFEGFARGDDPHRTAAALVYNKPYSEVTKPERQATKSVQFGVLYGMGAKSLAEQLAITKEEAQELIDTYKSRLSNVGTWDAKSRAFGVTNGFVTSWFGRHMPLWAASNPDPYVRSGAERLAVNAQIQGGAADYTKLAMIRAWGTLKKAGLWGNDKVMLTMNQHDSLTFEVSDDLDMNEIRGILQEAVVFDARQMFPKMQIPVFPRFDVDWELGKTWGGSVGWPLEVEATRTESGWAVEGKEDSVDVREWDRVEEDTSISVQTLELPPETLHVIITAKEQNKSTIIAFGQLVKSNPGDTVVYLTMKGQTHKLGNTTSLSKKDASRVSMALGGAEVVERTQEEMNELL